jgi:hypothetical protein
MNSRNDFDDRNPTRSESEFQRREATPPTNASSFSIIDLSIVLAVIVVILLFVFPTEQSSA